MHVFDSVVSASAQVPTTEIFVMFESDSRSDAARADVVACLALPEVEEIASDTVTCTKLQTRRAYSNKPQIRPRP
eukprot:5010331-Amphidinium_carterae.1